MALTMILRMATDWLIYGILASYFAVLFGLDGIRWIRIALALPPVLYTVQLIRKGWLGAEYYRQLQKLKTASAFFCLMPFLAVFRAGDGTFARLMQMVFLPVLLFFLLQILLLRLLRQDPAVIAGKRFQLVNAALIAGVAMAAAFLMISGTTHGLAQLLALLWVRLLYPVVRGVLWIFSATIGWAVYLFIRLMVLLFRREESQDFEEAFAPEVPEMPEELLELGGTTLPSWVFFAFCALAVILACWLIRQLFRLLMDQTKLRRSKDAFNEDRTRLPIERTQKGPGLSAYFTAAGRIRRAYRSFAKQILKMSAGQLPLTDQSDKTIAAAPAFLSEDLAALGQGRRPDLAEEIAELTEIYRRARYADLLHPVSAADAKRAERLAGKLSQPNQDV